ncbi:MAG: modification methylase [Parcubacteria group bacterium Gr01-1014_38]|nr:MAG: modification methylase [Parcubacteria group bacterium Gr01-1014_38]
MENPWVSYYNTFMPSNQIFKAVYFPDYKEANLKAKGFILAFGSRNKDVYKSIADLGSNELRNLLRTNSYLELEQRAQQEGLPVNTYCLWYLRKNLGVEEPKAEEVKSKKTIAHFENKILEGDCLEIMKGVPAKSIDMILCDLPYGTTQNHWDSVIPLDQLWLHYERIVKDEGVIVLTAQGLFTATLMLSNPKIFKYKITWVKSKPTNFLNAKKQPLRKHEDVLVFYKSQPTYNPQMSNGEPYNKGFRKDQLTGSYGDFKTVEVKSNGERYPTDVIYFKTAESEGEVYHPTQKPIELGRYLIRTFTREGDIVLDNACGSGSFLVSAVLERRKFIGVEKNQEVYLFKKHKVDYIEVSKQRIKEAETQYKAESNKLKLF